MSIKSYFVAGAVVVTASNAYAMCRVMYRCSDGDGFTLQQTIDDAVTSVIAPTGDLCTKDGYVVASWDVSSTQLGIVGDTAVPGAEYNIPFGNDDTCASVSAPIRFTAQWAEQSQQTNPADPDPTNPADPTPPTIDATDAITPTSRAYTDSVINALQPQFAGLGANKLMTYGTTDGAVGSRDIVTELGTSTTANSVPTRGAILAGLNTKQNTINGTAGYVATNTGDAGVLGEKAIYGATTNFADALVEAGTLNTAIINAVNSELIQVAEGWRINTADNLTLLSIRGAFTLPDVSINGSNSICFRDLSQSTRSDEDGECSAATISAIGTLGGKSGMWGVAFEYGDIVGKSVCSANTGDTEGAVATVAQNDTMDEEFRTQSGNGTLNDNQYGCWCKMESIDGNAAVSRWVFRVQTASCDGSCARACAIRIVTNSGGLRTAMFNSVQ